MIVTINKNTLEIDAPKALVHSIFVHCQNNIRLWSETALCSFYEETMSLAEEMCDQLLEAKLTAKERRPLLQFRRSAKKKLTEHRKDKTIVLQRIFDDILEYEALGALVGFGFKKKQKFY